jgi:predicted  nucleic acid-binding Zn-ribbon protein
MTQQGPSDSELLARKNEFLNGAFNQPTMQELYKHIRQVGDQISALSEKMSKLETKVDSVKKAVCGYELVNGVWRT